MVGFALSSGITIGNDLAVVKVLFTPRPAPAGRSVHAGGWSLRAGGDALLTGGSLVRLRHESTP